MTWPEDETTLILFSLLSRQTSVVLVRWSGSRCAPTCFWITLRGNEPTPPGQLWTPSSKSDTVLTTRCPEHNKIKPANGESSSYQSTYYWCTKNSHTKPIIKYFFLKTRKGIRYNNWIPSATAITECKNIDVSAAVADGARPCCFQSSSSTLLECQ